MRPSLPLPLRSSNHIGARLGKLRKLTRSPRKIFDFEIFVLNTFWNILNRVHPKKFFLPQFFCHFFTNLALSAKSDIVAGKKFTRAKFDFEVIGLKYVLKDSKPIPTKKCFDQKFLTRPFFTIWLFWPKNGSPSKKFFSEKIFRF